MYTMYAPRIHSLYTHSLIFINNSVYSLTCHSPVHWGAIVSLTNTTPHPPYGITNEATVAGKLEQHHYRLTTAGITALRKGDEALHRSDMSALTPTPVRFCLEICLTRLTGAVGQTKDSHYSARARFHHYPAVHINSVEQRDQQCPNDMTFLFNVNHRCRFTLTEPALLAVLPFAVTIEIVDENSRCIGTASVPLRTAPNAASSMAMSKTNGRGGLLRSISLFDAYGKYAGVLEADCVVYPEPKDHSAAETAADTGVIPPTPPLPSAGSPVARSLHLNQSAAAARVAPLRTSALGGVVSAGATPQAQQQQQQQDANGTTAAAAGQPIVLRVVVDETKFGGGRHNDPYAHSTSIAASPIFPLSGGGGGGGHSTVSAHGAAPPAAPAVPAGEVAAEDSLFYYFQYDVVLQLRSITETLLATVAREEGRLATVRVGSKVRRDGRVRELLDAVESVGWLANVCLQIASNLAAAGFGAVAAAGVGVPLATAGASPQTPRQSMHQQQSASVSSPVYAAADADRHRPNYALSAAPPERGTMLHLLRFEVLYQVQCQSVNLSLLAGRHRAALDGCPMARLHQQHRDFFKRLARAIVQLNRCLNIVIQATFDNNFRERRGDRHKERERERGRVREGGSPSRRRRSDTPPPRRRDKDKGVSRSSRRSRSRSSDSSSSSASSRGRSRRGRRDTKKDQKSSRRGRSRSSSSSSSSSSSAHYSSDFSNASSAAAAAKKSAPPPPPPAAVPTATAVGRGSAAVVNATPPPPPPVAAGLVTIVPTAAAPPQPAPTTVTQPPPLTISTVAPQPQPHQNPANSGTSLATFTPIGGALNSAAVPPPPALPSAVAAALQPHQLATSSSAGPTAVAGTAAPTPSAPTHTTATAAAAAHVTSIVNPNASAITNPDTTIVGSVANASAAGLDLSQLPMYVTTAPATQPLQPPSAATTAATAPLGGGNPYAYVPPSASSITSPHTAEANVGPSDLRNSMFNADFRPFGGSFTSGGGGQADGALLGATGGGVSSIAANDRNSTANRSVAPSMNAVAAMHGIY